MRSFKIEALGKITVFTCFWAVSSVNCMGTSDAERSWQYWAFGLISCVHIRIFWVYTHTGARIFIKIQFTRASGKNKFFPLLVPNFSLGEDK